MFNIDELAKNVKRILDTDTLEYETSIETFDSLDLTEIMCVIEDLFNIQLSISEIKECRTYGDLLHKVKRHDS